MARQSGPFALRQAGKSDQGLAKVHEWLKSRALRAYELAALSQAIKSYKALYAQVKFCVELGPMKRPQY